MVLLIFEYLVLAVVIIFATSRASYYVDDLDKKTKLSGAFIGGILLATVTSLPEFVTSITSTVALGEPGLAFGNVFGSNMFNIVILAVADIFFLRHMFLNQVKEGKNTSYLVILMYTVFTIPLLFGLFTAFDYGTLGVTIGITFNIISFVIIGIYFINILFLTESNQDEDPGTSKHTYKRIISAFVIWAIVIVVASVLVTNVTSDLAVKLNLNTSLAGAIFLGVATSLPEFTAVFTLIKLKNYDAAFTNIIGSNIFNMTILSVVDFINIDNNIYETISKGTELRENVSLLLILGLINSIIIMLVLKRKEIKNKLIYIIPSIIIIINYILYISLSVL